MKTLAVILGTWMMFMTGLALGQSLLLLGSGGGGTISVGAAYNAIGVNFDGNNTYLSRNAALTGAPTSAKVGIVSYWFRLKGGDNTAMIYYESDTSGQPALVAQALRQADNTVRLNENNAGTMQAATNSTFQSAANVWNHILVAWDAGNNRVQMYVNNTAQGNLTFANNAVNVASATDWGIGGRIVGAPTVLMNGDVADLYVNLAETIDLSVAANRAKFTNGSHPVNIGNTCNLPTGNSPLVCLGGPAFTGNASNWLINNGTGGNFISHGNGLTLSGAPGP